MAAGAILSRRRCRGHHRSAACYHPRINRIQPTFEIRSVKAADMAFLEAMLFEAFFWDATVERPAFSEFRRRPEFTRILSGWGRHGDRCVIAEDSGRQLGAAWFRLWTAEHHSFGFV